MNLLKETQFTWISARVYMGKISPPTPAISLSQVTLWITTFISPRNPEFDICVRVSIL